MAVTVKKPAVPVMKVALLALVIDGAWFTVSVKFCVAAVPKPLLAVMVKVSVPGAVGVPLNAIVPVPLLGIVTPGIAFRTFVTVRFTAG